MTTVRALVLPSSLAVVGASPRNPAAVETVVRSGMKAWGVNPNHEEVAGLRCYPSVAALPEVPEAALLMVNHERVEEAFEEAAAAGVRAFVVPGVGAEAGAAAKPTTERLVARARELGAALLGPNCMGVVVPGGPAAWNGLPPDTTAPGHVAVLCQSGSIADAFLSLGGRIGLRCVISSHHFLFPLTTVNIAPGIPNVGLERYIPDGPARTTEVTDYYFGPEASPEEIEELMAWDSQVGEEDVSLVQSVQRGLESGAVPQGRLMAESEKLIADFQRRVRDALLP